MLYHRLSVIGEFLHHPECKFLYFYLTVCVCRFSICCLNYLSAGTLSVVDGVAQWRFALLVLNVYNFLRALDEVLTNVRLAVTSCEVQSGIPKLVLVLKVDLPLFANTHYAV